MTNAPVPAGNFLSRVASRSLAENLSLLLLPLSTLIVWGPPRLRSSARGLEAALEAPLALDPGAVFQVGTWMVAAVVVCVLLARHAVLRTTLVPSLAAAGPMRWYLLFGLLAVASAAYSPAPLYTLYFAMQMLVGTLALAMLLEPRGASGAAFVVRIFFWVTVANAAAILVLYLINPLLAGDGAGSDTGYRLHGGMLRDYGKSAAYAGVLFLCLTRGSPKSWQRRIAAVAYLASWVMILAAKTRSTTVAAAAMGVLVLATHPNPRVKRGVVLGLPLAGVAALALGLVSPLVQLVTREGAGISDLSGRTVAFSFLVEKWQSSPLWGLGFAAGVRSSLVQFVGETRLGIGAAHDVLSKVLIDLGLVGLLILATTFVATWWGLARAWKRERHNEERFLPVLQLTCIMVSITLHSLVSASIGGPYVPFVVIVVALWALGRDPMPVSDTTLAERGRVRVIATE